MGITDLRKRDLCTPCTRTYGACATGEMSGWLEELSDGCWLKDGAELADNCWLKDGPEVADGCWLKAGAEGPTALALALS